jgi:hypothetical protein
VSQGRVGVQNRRVSQVWAGRSQGRIRQVGSQGRSGVRGGGGKKHFSPRGVARGRGAQREGGGVRRRGCRGGPDRLLFCGPNRGSYRGPPPFWHRFSRAVDRPPPPFPIWTTGGVEGAGCGGAVGGGWGALWSPESEVTRERRDL